MLDKMKQLMEMKKQADKIKRELESSDVSVDEKNGIKIIVNGAQKFKSIEIDESLVPAEYKKKLESHILRSVNAAVKQSQNIAAQKMKDLMPGGFPGM